MQAGTAATGPSMSPRLNTTLLATSPGFAPLDIQRLTQLVGAAPTSLRDGLARMLDEDGSP